MKLKHVLLFEELSMKHELDQLDDMVQAAKNIVDNLKQEILKLDTNKYKKLGNNAVIVNFKDLKNTWNVISYDLDAQIKAIAEEISEHTLPHKVREKLRTIIANGFIMTAQHGKAILDEKIIQGLKNLLGENDTINEDMEMKVYDINTWKYLLHESDMEVGKILGIESIKTGSELTKKDQAAYDEKDIEIYLKNDYKPPKYFNTEPDWYKHLDIRFNVKTKSGEQSWHIKTVLPITADRFYKLGGKED